MTGIEDLARRYFEHVRAKDAAGVAGMFAADGVFAPPGGERVCGPAAIEAYYRDVFAAAAPNPQVHAIAADGDLCFVEIVALRPDGTRSRAIDLFTVDRAGRIAELAVYFGPVLGR